MEPLEALLARATARESDALKRLFRLIEIPSVSSQSQHDGDCDRAADLLCDYLRAIGFTAERLRSQAHDMVLAHYVPQDPVAAAKKRILFYGHYDVQPPDPLELWDGDPFVPQIIQSPENEAVIYGRGASDDKGQLMTFIEAFGVFKEVTGDLPCPITVLLEGDEENLSLGMADFLKNHHEALDGDVVFICDTGFYGFDDPAIATRLRGILYEEITVTSADRDLHSGQYGGSAQNAANVLIKALADLTDDRGRITIPGFYDGIDEISDELLATWAALNFREEDFLGAVDLSEPAGEKGLSALERLWARPTMDINGITAGYTGEGAKTVISNQAKAKVSFRLAPGQNPETIQQAFRGQISAALPADCQVSFENFGLGPGVKVAEDGLFMRAALDAAEAEWGKRPVLIGMGGSIPVVELFQSILGIDSILLGFSKDDDRIHSPNEKYDLRSFTKGVATWTRLLEAISRS